MSAADPARPIEESDTFLPLFNADGLLPCITVDDRTGEVVMLAWMNAEALLLTLQSGFVHYWSRSRQEIWKKGASSGALQEAMEIKVDCDQDTLLVRARIARPSETCHTGRPTCFYRSVPLGPGPAERKFTGAVTDRF